MLTELNFCMKELDIVILPDDTFEKDTTRKKDGETRRRGMRHMRVLL